MISLDGIKDNEAAGAITARILTAAAEGRLGKYAEWLYWHLDGVKTKVAAWLAVATALLAFAQWIGLCALAGVKCDTWATHLEVATGTASAVFLYLGQVAGALHVMPPAKPWWITLGQVPAAPEAVAQARKARPHRAHDAVPELHKEGA